MTCAKSRTIFGSTSYNSISRFLKEIPEEDLSEESVLSLGETSLEGTFDNSGSYEWSYGNKSNIKSYNIDLNPNLGKVAVAGGFSFKTPASFLNGLNTNKKSKSIDISEYKEGARVYHKKFGEGTINYVEEEGEDYKVDINFDKVRTQTFNGKICRIRSNKLMVKTDEIDKS
jgi:DNA helicase-2/ATP-dependent DNA helicase PcrA